MGNIQAKPANGYRVSDSL